MYLQAIFRQLTVIWNTVLPADAPSICVICGNPCRGGKNKFKNIYEAKSSVGRLNIFILLELLLFFIGLSRYVCCF